MSSSPRLLGLVFATLAAFLSSCIVFPIPSTEEAVAGRAGVGDEIQAIVSGGEDVLDVRTKLGEPIIDFGPTRVFV